MKVRIPRTRSRLRRAKKQPSRGEGHEPETASWQERVQRSSRKSALKLGGYASVEQAQARVERVEALRAQVRAGTYQIDSQSLAEKMLASGQRFEVKDTIALQKSITDV